MMRAMRATEHSVSITPRSALFGGTLYVVHCLCGFDVLAMTKETAAQFKAAHLEDVR